MSATRRGSGVVAALTLLAVSVVGVASFLLPFVVSAVGDQSRLSSGRAIEASLLLAAIIAGSVLLAAGELAREPRAGGLARALSLLAVLAAIDATLRLIPSFLGASPIFALIILVGFVFGPRFGFVMGAMTLVLSAAITGGAGPWLPYQMLCAGWVGMAAGWVPRSSWPKSQLALLAAFGVVAGFAYGALMNLFSWPFALPGVQADVGLYWNPGLSLRESVSRYGSFYMATSFVHDATRAAANAALLVVVGPPVLRLLHRLRVRASWIANDLPLTSPLGQ